MGMVAVVGATVTVEMTLMTSVDVDTEPTAVPEVAVYLVFVTVTVPALAWGYSVSVLVTVTVAPVFVNVTVEHEVAAAAASLATKRPREGWTSIAETTGPMCGWEGAGDGRGACAAIPDHKGTRELQIFGRRSNRRAHGSAVDASPGKPTPGLPLPRICLSVQRPVSRNHKSGTIELNDEINLAETEDAGVDEIAAVAVRYDGVVVRVGLGLELVHGAIEGAHAIGRSVLGQQAVGVPRSAGIHDKVRARVITLEGLDAAVVGVGSGDLVLVLIGASTEAPFWETDAVDATELVVSVARGVHRGHGDVRRRRDEVVCEDVYQWEAQNVAGAHTMTYGFGDLRGRAGHGGSLARCAGDRACHRHDDGRGAGGSRGSRCSRLKKRSIVNVPLLRRVTPSRDLRFHGGEAGRSRDRGGRGRNIDRGDDADDVCGCRPVPDGRDRGASILGSRDGDGPGF
nr:hypothetical protein CFP56_28623 [Quercus suber]